MTTLFRWILATALLPLAGAPLLCRAVYRPFPPVVRILLAASTGAVLVSLTMTVLSTVHILWRVPLILACAALGSWALSLLTNPQRLKDELVRYDGNSPSVGARAMNIAAVLAALAATASGACASIDYFIFWAPKAQAYQAARGIDASFLGAHFHEYLHVCYPPLVTNIDAFLATAAGKFSWFAPTLAFPILLAALVLLLPALCQGATTPTDADATTALVVAVLAVIGIRTNIAGNGDMPLFFFETTGIALALRRDAQAPAIQVLMGIQLAGAASAKVEGLPFAIAAILLFGLTRAHLFSSRSFNAVRLFLPLAAVVASWSIFGFSHRLFTSYSEYGPFFVVYWNHWWLIWLSLLIAIASVAWGLPFVVPLLPLAAARPLPRAALIPLGASAAVLAFAVFAYLHMKEDPSNWIATSAPRLLAPCAVLVCLARSASTE